MTDDFLSRWSRRKVESRSGIEAAPAALAPQQAIVPAPAIAPIVPGAAAQAPAALPPLESLTIDSDFSPFMQPGVDSALRRQALKTLLNDPRFNVMDGLDVYIDDYSKPDPLPPGWLEQLNQVARMNEHHVPPVPAEAVAIAEGEVQTVEEQQLAGDPVAPSKATAGPDSPTGEQSGSA